MYAFFLWSVLWTFSFLDCFDSRVLFGIVKVMPGHHEKAGKFSCQRSRVFLFKLYLLRNQQCLLIPLEFHDVWSLPSWALASGDCAALGGRKQTNIKPSPDLDKHWYFSLGDKTVESFKTAQTSPQDPNWKSRGMFDRPKNESEKFLYLWPVVWPTTDFGNWESLGWQLWEMAGSWVYLGRGGVFVALMAISKPLGGIFCSKKVNDRRGRHISASWVTHLRAKQGIVRCPDQLVDGRTFSKSGGDPV